MPRPTGIKEPKPRRRKKIIPGFAAWQRLWIGGHYKEKGLSLELFQELGSRSCHYCGAPPRLTNPFGHSYDHYLKQNKKPCKKEWFEDQWIYTNGVDKMIHQENYLDLSNLVPCCALCNFMKQRMSHDAFIARCQKISQFNSK